MTTKRNLVPDYEKRDIKISQIDNLENCFAHIHFSSETESEDLKLLKSIAETSEKKGIAVFVIDLTPEEKDEGLKRYSLIFGQKKVYACSKLHIPEISVRVVFNKNLNQKYLKDLADADYMSLSEYEKGKFLSAYSEENQISAAKLCDCTGLVYNTTRTFVSAYTASVRYSPLEEAFRNGNFYSRSVLGCKPLYSYVKASQRDHLTELLIKYKTHKYTELLPLIKKGEDIIAYLENNTGNIKKYRKVKNFSPEYARIAEKYGISSEDVKKIASACKAEGINDSKTFEAVIAFSRFCTHFDSDDFQSVVSLLHSSFRKQILTIGSVYARLLKLCRQGKSMQFFYDMDANPDHLSEKDMETMTKLFSDNIVVSENGGDAAENTDCGFGEADEQ